MNTERPSLSGRHTRAASQIFELGLDQGVQIHKANRDGEQNISGRGQRKQHLSRP